MCCIVQIHESNPNFIVGHTMQPMIAKRNEHRLKICCLSCKILTQIKPGFPVFPQSLPIKTHSLISDELTAFGVSQSGHLLTIVISPIFKLWFRGKLNEGQCFMSDIFTCFNIYVLASLTLKLKDSALFNNSVVWLGGAGLRADILLPGLYSSQGCFCQTVKLVNMSSKLGNSGSLEEVQLIICVPLEHIVTPLWPHLTSCHSEAKWGNHARGNNRFGPWLNTFFTRNCCLFPKTYIGAPYF